MKAFALDIGGTTIQYGMGDEQGMITTGQTKTMAKQGGEALMDRILTLIEKHGQGAQAIGICSAGQIDSQSGKVVHATESLPGWTGMNVRQRVQERFPVPFAIENDVNAAALGEGIYGSMKGISDFLAVMIGTGVGGAIMIDGKIYKGALGNGGEFGHMITHIGGIACACGQKGCYEAYASTTALKRLAKEAGNLPISGKEIFALQDTTCKELIEKWQVEVVAGLVSLCCIFHPSHIMLGGGIMQQPGLAEQLQEKLRAQLMPSFQGVTLVPAGLPQQSGLLGALHIALTQAR